MSYERGRRLGNKAAKFAAVLATIVFAAGLLRNPVWYFQHPVELFKWWLVGAGVYFAVAIISLGLMYVRLGADEEGADE